MEKIKQIGFKKHLMTAISFFLPIIVASGFLLAIGNMMGGASIENFRDGFSFADTMTTMGGYGLGFLPMIVSTAIAYSIGDKPGIAPGLIVGFVAHGIGTGFLGGVVGGYVAGYTVALLMAVIKVPKWMEGLLPTLVLPFLSAFIAGMVMYYVVGTPIIWFTDLITAYLGNLNTSSLFLYGAIIGVLASIDYGGAINKVVFAFVFALFSEGIYEPITVLILVSMTTPYALGSRQSYSSFRNVCNSDNDSSLGFRSGLIYRFSSDGNHYFIVEKTSRSKRRSHRRRRGYFLG